jgi:hypothetical protein
MQYLCAARLSAACGIVATALVLGARAQSTLETPGIAPPLPCAPRSGAAFAGQPILSWHRLEGSDRARVELSPSLDFDEATIHRFDVTGERLALPVTWPPGVWYWRLRGLAHGVVGDRTTPTWTFSVESARPTAARVPRVSRLTR